MRERGISASIGIRQCAFVVLCLLLLDVSVAVAVPTAQVVPTAQEAPTAVGESSPKLALGIDTSCLLESGRLTCVGEVGSKPAPPEVSSWDQVSLGLGSASCGIGDGEVICWGSPGSGILNVPALDAPYLVAVGRRHACAADRSGVKCWGAGGMGQLAAPLLDEITDLAAGVDVSCAISGQRLSCWGDSWVTGEVYQALESVQSVAPDGRY